MDDRLRVVRSRLLLSLVLGRPAFRCFERHACLLDLDISVVLWRHVGDLQSLDIRAWPF